MNAAFKCLVIRQLPNEHSQSEQLFRRKVPFPQSESNTIIYCACPALRIRVPDAVKVILIKGALKVVQEGYVIE